MSLGVLLAALWFILTGIAAVAHQALPDFWMGILAIGVGLALLFGWAYPLVVNRRVP